VRRRTGAKDEQRREAPPAAEALLAALPECVRLLTPEGFIDYINPAGLWMLGLHSLDQVKGRRWASQWPDEHPAELEAALLTARKGGVGRFQGVCYTAGGVRKWWDTTMTPVRAPDGQVTRLMALSREVTASAEAEAFFNTIVHLLPNPLLVKSAADGRYVLINRAAEETFGLSRAEALGKTAFELFPAEEARLFAEEDAEVIRSREVRVSEEEPITTRAGLRYFTTKKLATFDGDRPLHLVIIGEDVTERRAAALALKHSLAEAEAAHQAKSAFLANMSHEIRTPLNGVVGVADLLARTELTASQRELVEVIRSCGSTLDRMLLDVLDLSKIEAGKLSLSAEPFNLAALAQSVAGLMRPIAEEKNLRFELDCDPAADLVVSADPVRLRQILTNLLSNAIKFTDAGSVTLRVRRTGDHTYQFVVADTGIGFDETVRQRLFDRFEQADGTINRRYGGTGLGLAISRQLASMMGGELECESAPGEGSAFMVTLPLPPAPARQTQESDAGGNAVEGLAVLAVDDHAANRKVVQIALEAAGATVQLAENGEQALALFRQRRFDLVLMDMQMPQMDGLAATRAIRQIETDQRRAPTPVVMLTANTSEDHVRMALEAGADTHLGKPLRPDALLRMISTLVSGPAGAAGGTVRPARHG